VSEVNFLPVFALGVRSNHMNWIATRRTK